MPLHYITRPGLQGRMRLPYLWLGLAALLGVIVEPAFALPPSLEFLGGAFWFTSAKKSAGDVQGDLRLRNPLVADATLLFRALESSGTESSVYAYDLTEVLAKLGTWEVAPRAVSPAWDSVIDRSAFKKPVQRVTSLYRGPGYGANDGDLGYLWVLRGNRFDKLPEPGFYKGVIARGGSEALALEDRVTVDGRPWFACKKDAGCKAVVNLGLDWLPRVGSFPKGLLAVGYADGGENQWVCVMGAPDQPCRPGAANVVSGRQPLFAADGKWLAVAEQPAAAAGGDANDSWSIRVYQVQPSPAGLTLTPAWTSPPVSFYGGYGPGGDYVEYHGSYAWSEGRLYFQRLDALARPAGQAPVVSSWQPTGDIQSLPLPTEIAINNPFYCDTPLWRDAQKEGPGWTRLYWAPAPFKSPPNCGGEGSAKSLFHYRLLDVYAIQPIRLDGQGQVGDYVAVQALIQSLDSHKTLERILLFRMP